MVNPSTAYPVTDVHAQFEKFWNELPPSLKERGNKAVTKLAYVTGREDEAKHAMTYESND